MAVLKFDLKTAIWGLALVLAQGCNFREDKTPTLPLELNRQTAPGYVTLRRLVFEGQCIGCHGGAGGVSLETYDQAKLHASAILSQVVTEGSMPPQGPLAARERDWVRLWVQAGAPEFDTEVGIPFPTPSGAPGLSASNPWALGEAQNQNDEPGGQ